MKSFYLSEITTKDGLLHQGIFLKPQKPGKKALLWIHGLSGRFYGDVKMMEELAVACEEKGFGLASFNNRGHDMVASAHRGDEYVTIGAGNEKFQDCVLDIQAQILFLNEQGFSEVVLAGSSTGANKVCFYAATQNDPHVAGIILAGPISDRYSSGYAPEMYKKYKAFMQKEIDEGRGDELKVGYDFLPLTPNRWMSMYSEGTAEDVFNYYDGQAALKQFSKITKPLMVMIGKNDEHADGKVQEIQKLFDSHTKSKKYKSVVIPAANHGFDGKEKEVVEAVVSWVQTI